MKLQEFLNWIGEPNRYLSRTWTPEEIRSMARSRKKQDAVQLQALFCFLKATRDPDRKIAESMARWRATGMEETMVVQCGTQLHMADYDLEAYLQEAFSDLFSLSEKAMEAGEDPYLDLSIEELYSDNLL